MRALRRELTTEPRRCLLLALFALTCHLSRRLDKLQQEGLCKTASGTNPTTGANTRKSLGCGGRPRGSPSAYMTDDSSAKPEALFPEDRFSSYKN